MDREAIVENPGGTGGQEPGNGRGAGAKDALRELQNRLEAAIDEVRPKIRRALEELDEKMDEAVRDVRPRAQSAMREVQPRIDQFVADVQPRLDSMLTRLQSRLEDLRRDLEDRASRTARRAGAEGSGASDPASPGGRLESGAAQDPNKIPGTDEEWPPGVDPGGTHRTEGPGPGNPLA
jgi:ElaB/YqjD/DUF883 family membrane-anchored ribosome-binding protein